MAQLRCYYGATGALLAWRSGGGMGWLPLLGVPWRLAPSPGRIDCAVRFSGHGTLRGLRATEAEGAENGRLPWAAMRMMILLQK